MQNLSQRVLATGLFMAFLGFPAAAYGLQHKKPPLSTKTQEPTPRILSLKLPLEGVRFHWCFMDREKLLSGKLTVHLKREDTTKEIVIFEAGEITPGWETVSHAPCQSGLYFMFVSNTRYLTAPGDELEVELIAPEDLEGIGAYQTGTFPAGTYRTTGTYFDLRDGSDAPQTSMRLSESEMADSMTNAGKTQVEVEAALKGRRLALSMQTKGPNLFGPMASLGCWENPWPLRITYHEGWSPPEAIAMTKGLMELMDAQAGREGGYDCSGPI